MREVLSGIWTWPWFSEPHGYNFNGHLILHAGGNLCIDPVEPAAADLEEIARLGVSRILLTNRNHSRAANKVCEPSSATMCRSCSTTSGPYQRSRASSREYSNFMCVWRSIHVRNFCSLCGT